MSWRGDAEARVWGDVRAMLNETTFLPPLWLIVVTRSSYHGHRRDNTLQRAHISSNTTERFRLSNLTHFRNKVAQIRTTSSYNSADKLFRSKYPDATTAKNLTSSRLHFNLQHEHDVIPSFPHRFSSLQCTTPKEEQRNNHILNIIPKLHIHPLQLNIFRTFHIRIARPSTTFPEQIRHLCVTQQRR